MHRKTDLKLSRALLIMSIACSLYACNDSGKSKSATKDICSDGISQFDLGNTVPSKAIYKSHSNCYSFNATAGQVYTITLITHVGDSDTSLASDSSFSSIIDSRDRPGTKPEVIIFTASNTAAHYVRIFGFSDSRYSLYINKGANSPPMASFSWSKPTPKLVDVRLDAADSFDLDNDTLSYNWSLIGKPEGSLAVLSNTAQVVTSFNADVAGYYQVQLITSDHADDSLPFIGWVQVLDISNTHPIAAATWTQPTRVLNKVKLDGLNSSDADGHKLTYKWNLINKPIGSNAVLTNANQVSASFTPDMIGDYEFSLIVNDSFDDSAALHQVISSSNSKPIAEIQANQVAAIGQPTLLDPKDSHDADGHELNFHWQLVSKPNTSNLTFQNQSGATATFNADVFGDYTFQLIADDTIELSEPVNTTVSVSQYIKRLQFDVTDAAYNQSMNRIVMVSSQNNKLYTYNPVDQSTTELSLNHTPTSVSISPDGQYAAVGHNGSFSYIDLNANNVQKNISVYTNTPEIVLDANGNAHIFSARGYPNMSIHINTESYSTGEHIPSEQTAHLHTDGTSIYSTSLGSSSIITKLDISSGATIYLNSTDSFADPQTNRACGNLWGSEDGRRLFTACGSVFKTADEKNLDMEYNRVLEDFNTHIIDLSHSQESGRIILIAKSTDTNNLENKVFQYDYEYLNKISTTNLPNITTRTGAYTAQGKYIFYNSDGSQYYVITQSNPDSGLTDDYSIISSSHTGDITGINNKPISRAGHDQSTLINNLVKLDGLQSYDTDNDTLSYQWEMIETPIGSTSHLLNETTATPEFTTDIKGAYSIRLIVNDGFLNSEQDIIKITALNNNASHLVSVNYDVIDAEYSHALNSIISVSKTENMLHSFNTQNFQQTKLALPETPISVSVSPNGLFAAVAHKRSISYIDLSTNTFIKTLAVEFTEVSDVILAGNGYVHIVPSLTETSPQIHSINISTDQQFSNDTYFNARRAKMHPSGSVIYSSWRGPKYDISSGPATPIYSPSKPLNGNNLWFSQNGSQVFIPSGSAYRTSADHSTDLAYIGQLENFAGYQITGLSHTTTSSLIALIATNLSATEPSLFTDDRVYFFNDTYHANTSSEPLHSFATPANNFTAHGKFIFYNNDGTHYYVVVKADSSSGLLNDYGISIH